MSWDDTLQIRLSYFRARYKLTLYLACPTLISQPATDSPLQLKLLGHVNAISKNVHLAFVTQAQSLGSSGTFTALSHFLSFSLSNYPPVTE